MNNISIIDKDYRVWLQELGKRYRQSQIKAAVSVNREMLQFYWSLGHDIVERLAKKNYGSGFFRNLSADLNRVLPEAKGLSPRNLRYMQRFYQLYSQENEILQQFAAKPEATDKHDDIILQQLAAKFRGEMFSVPWGHHMLIIDKCQNDLRRALYYVHQTVENGWSRAVLLNMLSTDLYEREGKAQDLPQHLRRLRTTRNS